MRALTSTLTDVPRTPALVGQYLPHRLWCPGSRGWLGPLVTALLLAPLFGMLTLGGLLELRLGISGDDAAGIALATALAIPSYGAMVFFVLRCLVSLVERWRYGSTVLELSEHPVAIGRPLGLFLVHRGGRVLRSLRATLQCTERTTIDAHETRGSAQRLCRVYAQLLFENPSFSGKTGLPLVFYAVRTLPGGAMHSLHTPHRTVAWSIALCASVPGESDFVREFDLVVHPTPARRPTIQTH